MKPDASKYNPSPAYLRELVGRSGLSQRAAAKLLGVSDRAMRHWLSGAVDAPYSVQFCLEALAKSPAVGPEQN